MNLSSTRTVNAQQAAQRTANKPYAELFDSNQFTRMCDCFGTISQFAQLTAKSCRYFWHIFEIRAAAK
jgi:hypothetical protein